MQNDKKRKEILRGKKTICVRIKRLHKQNKLTATQTLNGTEEQEANRVEVEPKKRWLKKTKGRTAATQNC